MNSNCQIREKSLYLKWCSLCASLPARQFLFPAYENMRVPPSPYNPPDALLMESVGVLADTVGWKIGIYGFARFKIIHSGCIC